MAAKKASKSKGIPYVEENEKTGKITYVYPDGTKKVISKGSKKSPAPKMNFGPGASFAPSKVRRMQGYKPSKFDKKFIEDEYQMAKEVAGQPAITKKDKKTRVQARKDVRYLEAKYPSLIKGSAKKSTTAKKPKKK